MSDTPHDVAAAMPPLIAQSLQASLTVANVTRSREWYCSVLGFVVDREFRREEQLFAVSLRAGDVRLLLTQDDGAKGTERVKGEGISLQLTTRQDIFAVADFVKRAGAVLHTEPFEARGVRAFRVRDPDGFLFVFSSPRDG